MYLLINLFKGKLSWAVNLKKTAFELFKFDSRRHRCKAKPPAYDGALTTKKITPDKRADSLNEKWPENLACCHKWIYLNACAVHDSFPLIKEERKMVNYLFHYNVDVCMGLFVCLFFFTLFLPSSLNIWTTNPLPRI